MPPEGLANKLVRAIDRSDEEDPLSYEEGRGVLRTLENRLKKR